MSTFVKHTRLTTYCFLICGVASAVSHAQLSKDLQWSNELVEKSRNATQEERVKVIDQVLQRLSPHAATDPDIRGVTSVLALQRDLLLIDPGEVLEQAKMAGANGVMPWERTRHMNTARIELLDRLSYLISTLDPSKITAADAQKISEFAKYALQAVDELKDPAIIGGKTSELTRLATRINGITKLAQGVQDPGARTILGGLRGTLGTIERKIGALGVTVPSPMRAFEVPAEVAAAIVDNSRKGMDESAAALNEVSNAIRGDARALERFRTHAERVKTILSLENTAVKWRRRLASESPTASPLFER